jgi:hypothetical protein
MLGCPGFPVNRLDFSLTESLEVESSRERRCKASYEDEEPVFRRHGGCRGPVTVVGLTLIMVDQTVQPIVLSWPEWTIFANASQRLVA